MSPNLAAVEVAVGQDSDESTGAEPRGDFGAGEGGALGLVTAATMMDVSYRQAKRLWRRYRTGGARAVQHGLAGRPSNRRLCSGSSPRLGADSSEVQRAGDRAVWSDVGSRAFGERGRGAGPSRDAAPVDAGRRVMESGASAVALSRPPRPKSARGELVQLDGSFHAWFEIDRRPGPV